MKIKVIEYDDSDDDCRRTSYYAISEREPGKEIALSLCALDSREVKSRAQYLFGEDVEIEYVD